MLFSAKIVEQRAVGNGLISVGVIGFLFMMICMIVPSLTNLAPFFLAVLILIVIVAAIVFKGNLSSYQLMNDLMIFENQMQIGCFVFPYKEIRQLQFFNKSHNAGHLSSYMDSYEGLDNQVSFFYKHQKFEYFFYIKSPQHLAEFRAMLQALHLASIASHNQNGQGKMFEMKTTINETCVALQRKYQSI